MTVIRADQVGSLLRPPELIQARQKLWAGQGDPAALRRLEDEAIAAALERQEQTGIGILTDGEFRRVVYLTNLIEAVEGFAFGQGEPLPWKRGDQEVPPEMAGFGLPVVTQKLRRKGRVAEVESAFMREHAPGPFKITLPSPMHFAEASYREGVSDQAYPTRSGLLRDISAILADEAGALAAEGVPYVQVDSPSYTTWVDPERLDSLRRSEPDTDQLLDDAMAADNAVLDAARSGGATTSVHLCRGNGMGAWLASGPYDSIAEKLFQGLHCDRLLLEYDSERAGNFDALRSVPDDKVVVLGLVSTKSAELESRDEVLRRIEEAAAVVPVEQLALSPQCGFASDFRGNPLTPDQQWQKLELVASVASEVWG